MTDLFTGFGPTLADVIANGAWMTVVIAALAWTILRLMPGGIIGKDAAKVLQGLHHFNAGLDAKNHVLRMIVQKTDDKTKVTVTQDGKTWTVNDKNLNDLPEGLREKVKSILERSKTDF